MWIGFLNAIEIEIDLSCDRLQLTKRDEPMAKNRDRSHFGCMTVWNENNPSSKGVQGQYSNQVWERARRGRHGQRDS
jgi:hypothetical protein